MSENTQSDPATVNVFARFLQFIVRNLSHSDEASTSTPIIDSITDHELGIPAINYVVSVPQNLSHSDEASTSTPIIDRITEVNTTPHYVDESDDPTIDSLLDCATGGHNRGNQRRASICKVSGILRDLSESSFNPQLVSIGPIHREDPKLKEFEWMKKCYLNDLLHRFRDSTPRKKLKACLLKLNTLIPQIREFYAGVIENYSDVDLARMMVTDGCFILEFCSKHEDGENEYLPNKMQNLRIAMDLILLENQVPFIVLQSLFDCSMGNQSFTLSNLLDRYLASYIKLFKSQLPESISTRDVDSGHDHVLGYMHKRYQLVVTDSMEITEFHSITELDRSGMKFKPHQEGSWSMTFKFESSLFPCLRWFRSKPTLLMPTLVIEDVTELILRNFIAYEQLFPQGRYYFTSYAHAMDMLIDTQEDIARLVKSKVLVNVLGSNQEAADMINKVCKNISFTAFYYSQEFEQMGKYHDSFWPKNIARLKRVYFSDPWSAIVLIPVAIVVFILVPILYAIRAI